MPIGFPFLSGPPGQPRRQAQQSRPNFQPAHAPHPPSLSGTPHARHTRRLCPCNTEPTLPSGLLSPARRPGFLFPRLYPARLASYQAIASTPARTAPAASQRCTPKDLHAPLLSTVPTADTPQQPILSSFASAWLLRTTGSNHFISDLFLAPQQHANDDSASSACN